MENTATRRIASVDIYRGFVMFLMMAEVLEYCSVAGKLPESGFWKFMCWHQSHVEWVGCALHDMIQPSFSFLVGVALPFSIMNRSSEGQKFSTLFGHTLWRAFVLIVLGFFLRSMWSKQTYYTFEDTLTQIGLGYPILFLLGFAAWRTQIISLAAILLGYWAVFAFYPLPDAGFDYAAVGVPATWGHQMTGFAAHWAKNSNAAWAFDTWFLNLFPRESTFLFNEGGYSTLSFIPTLGTMILGLLAGQMLKNKELAPMDKVKKFALVGLGLVLAGLAIHFLGLCPIVKRIWTPTWTLFSGGLCFWFLAAFYWLADVREVRRPFFGLTVIGMNSIAAYVLAHTVIGFIYQSLQTHLGQGYDQILGDAYASLVRGGALLGVQWLVLWWMWREKIFIRI